MQAASDALRPACERPGAGTRIAALLVTALAPWPAVEGDDEDALALGHAWLTDALARRPMWAVREGLRQVYLGARWRPLPAEIPAAVDEAVRPLRAALAAAERRRRAAEEDAARAELTPEERERRRRFVEDLVAGRAARLGTRPEDLDAADRARRAAEEAAHEARREAPGVNGGEDDDDVHPSPPPGRPGGGPRDAGPPPQP